MTAAGRWFVTPHAVERFRELVPCRSYEHALGLLVNESERVHYVRLLETGFHLVRGPRPRRLRYVVAPPDAPGRLPALVTVLPAHDGQARLTARRRVVEAPEASEAPAR